MALVKAGSQLPCNGKRYIAFVFGDVIAILIPGSNTGTAITGTAITGDAATIVIVITVAVVTALL